ANGLIAVATGGQAVQDNLTATADPDADDDSTEGYSARSLWFNLPSSEVFRCMDASEGAAVWVKTSLTIDELGALALGDDAGDVPYSGDAPGSDVAAALNALANDTRVAN